MLEGCFHMKLSGVASLSVATVILEQVVVGMGHMLGDSRSHINRGLDDANTYPVPQLEVVSVSQYQFEFMGIVCRKHVLRLCLVLLSYS